MHFPEELIDLSEFKKPTEKVAGKAEKAMAKELIASMTSEWGAVEKYNDDYHKALEKLIEEKIEHGDEKAPKSVKKAPTGQRHRFWYLY